LAYDLFLRGTRAVRFRARAYLTYDRVIREGFVVRSNITQDINPNHVRFMFTMYVTRAINLDSVQAIESNTLDGLKSSGKLSDESILAAAAGQESSGIDVSEFL
jgi:hypothetical protein